HTATPDGKVSAGSDTTLSATIEAFNLAYAQGDVDVLDEMTVDSYLHISGNAAPVRKADWIKYQRLRSDQIRRGEVQMESYTMSETQVDYYDDMSIVTARIDIAYSQSGQRREDAYRVTQVWVKTESGWKRAAFHDTRII